MDDFGGVHCSVKVVVTGSVAMVEEIIQHITSASSGHQIIHTINDAAALLTIVINSLLPHCVPNQQYHDPSFMGIHFANAKQVLE